MQPVEETRTHLQEAVESHILRKQLSFPIDFDFERPSSEPSGTERPYISRARKSVKQFIPRDDSQLRAFCTANPDLDVHTRREAAGVLEALAIEVWRAEFASRNELVARIAEDAAALEQLARPILTEVGSLQEAERDEPSPGSDIQPSL